MKAVITSWKSLDEPLEWKIVLLVIWLTFGTAGLVLLALPIMLIVKSALSGDISLLPFAILWLCINVVIGWAIRGFSKDNCS